MLLLKNCRIQLQLKLAEDKVKNEKCVVDAKDTEMESLR